MTGIRTILSITRKTGCSTLIKKNRIILRLKSDSFPAKVCKSALNGVLEQDRDLHTETADDFKPVTDKTVDDANVIDDLVFANKIVKHSRSNAIVLAKNKQLYACEN